jgi:hypothetical protein
MQNLPLNGKLYYEGVNAVEPEFFACIAGTKNSAVVFQTEKKCLHDAFTF